MRALFGDEINSLDALQLDGVHPTSYWHREIAATIADDVESWLDALGDRRPWAQQEALQRIEREAQQAAVEPMGQALSPDSSSS